MKCSSCGKPVYGRDCLVLSVVLQRTDTVVLHYSCALSIACDIQAVSNLAKFARKSGWHQAEFPGFQVTAVKGGRA